MNRPIKFRAWDNKNKEFVYVVVQRGTCVIYACPKSDAELEMWQEFTNLLDKNGKEIYEGDIVEYEFLPEEIARQEVLYAGAAFCLHGQPINQISRAQGKEIGYIDLEIIGNIYENPELLSV